MRMIEPGLLPFRPYCPILHCPSWSFRRLSMSSLVFSVNRLM